MRLAVVLPVMVAVIAAVAFAFVKENHRDHDLQQNQLPETRSDGPEIPTGTSGPYDRGGVSDGEIIGNRETGDRNDSPAVMPSDSAHEPADRQSNSGSNELNVVDEESVTAPFDGRNSRTSLPNSGRAVQVVEVPVNRSPGMEYTPPTAGDVGIEFTAPSVSSGVDGDSMEGMADLEIGQAGPDGEESGLEYTIPEEGAPGMELILPDDNESGLEYSLPNGGE